jgi:hypothetical protein
MDDSFIDIYGGYAIKLNIAIRERT